MMHLEGITKNPNSFKYSVKKNEKKINTRVDFSNAQFLKDSNASQLLQEFRKIEGGSTKIDEIEYLLNLEDQDGAGKSFSKPDGMGEEEMNKFFQN